MRFVLVERDRSGRDAALVPDAEAHLPVVLEVPRHAQRLVVVARVRMEELHELAPLRRRAPRTETKSSVERPVTARAPGHVRSVCPLKASNETKHGPPGRAVRRAAA